MHAALLAAEAAATAPTIPPAGIGLIAFGILAALLAVAYTFRHAGNRH